MRFSFFTMSYVWSALITAGNNHPAISECTEKKKIAVMKEEISFFYVFLFTLSVSKLSEAIPFEELEIAWKKICNKLHASL